VMRHAVNFRAWLKQPLAWVVLVLSAAVGLSLYLSLSHLSNDAAIAKRAAEQQSAKDRADNVTLCAFFRTTDTGLQQIFDVSPTTAAGSVVVVSLGRIQQGARLVAASKLCPPRGKS
jgi:hypothetical protein